MRYLSSRVTYDDADVPATLHATIGARIDRLDSAAKRTLTAASVIGSSFDADLLGSLVDDTDVIPLVAAELWIKCSSAPLAEYAFRHPFIRAVAYRIAAEIRSRAIAPARGEADRSAGVRRRERSIDR